MRPRHSTFVILVGAAALLVACTRDPEPKPRSYFRIDLPEQTYSPWQEAGLMSAELPSYARIVERKRSDNMRWYDLRFPGQRATVHLTWSTVDGRLPQLIEDAHTLKDQHGAMARGMRSERVLRDSARVFGTLIDVNGDVASPMLFYLTDSTSNFLYGVLYFDTRPNADSLAPVTDRIRGDMRHLAATLRWAE
jgi:gliding motility-associated lipoprotein GldD